MIEEPKVLKTPAHGHQDRETTTHPAFGQISCARVSGKTALYGSDFIHRNFMAIRVATSSMDRTLSRDWHSERQQIIEVWLSEAQWATLVSSPNTGGGVPCTLKWTRETGEVPGLPPPKSRADQFTQEMKDTVGDALGRLDKAIRKLDSLGITKQKADQLREELQMARQEIRSNLPFVAQSFGEHVEDTIEAAKTEIHGFMQATIQRAGIAALSGSPLPLEIEDKTDGD